MRVNHGFIAARPRLYGKRVCSLSSVTVFKHRACASEHTRACVITYTRRSYFSSPECRRETFQHRHNITGLFTFSSLRCWCNAASAVTNDLCRQFSSTNRRFSPSLEQFKTIIQPAAVLSRRRLVPSVRTALQSPDSRWLACSAMEIYRHRGSLVDVSNVSNVLPRKLPSLFFFFDVSLAVSRECDN